ncbi:MAG: hypothetical protein AB1503_12320 [Bacillota bacterium]
MGVRPYHQVIAAVSYLVAGLAVSYSTMVEAKRGGWKSRSCAPWGGGLHVLPVLLTEVVLAAAIAGGLGGGAGLAVYAWLTRSSLSGWKVPCTLASCNRWRPPRVRVA